MIKIGIVGAPGSGKTTLGARLYAELLEQGVNSAGYVQEYAKEYLGAIGAIDQAGQEVITETQMELEQDAVYANFNPIICDSAIWLGAIYAAYTGSSRGVYIAAATLPANNKYTHLIYTPLFDTADKTDQFRIHNHDQAVVLDTMIREYLYNDTGEAHIIEAPKDLSKRQAFIEEFVDQIKAEV